MDFGHKGIIFFIKTLTIGENVSNATSPFFFWTQPPPICLFNKNGALYGPQGLYKVWLKLTNHERCSKQKSFFDVFLTRKNCAKSDPPRNRMPATIFRDKNAFSIAILPYYFNENLINCLTAIYRSLSVHKVEKVAFGTLGRLWTQKGVFSFFRISFFAVRYQWKCVRMEYA